MLESALNQQVQSSILMNARLTLQDVESLCNRIAVHPIPASPFIKEFDRVPDNSMFWFGMGFFVSPALALANASKWDLVPASA